MVFKNTGYPFPADNGIMTDTRDWDHEEAKTKVGE